jgi:ABC-type multidrug transport system fused ATPase/permease subunit
MQKLVDRLLAGGDRWPLLAVSILATFAAQSIVAVAIAETIGPVGLGIVRDLRRCLYDRLQRIDLPFFDQMPAGAIISRLMDDVAVIQSLITTQTLTILTDAGTTIGVFGLLMMYDRWIVLAAALILGVYGIAFRFFSRRIRAGSGEVRDRLDRVFSHLKERLDGVLVVKAYAREQAEIAEFSDRIRAAHVPRVRVGWLGAAFSNLSTGLNGVGTTIVLGVAVFESMRGSLSPGEVIAIGTLAGLLFGPISRLADVITVFEQAASSADRIGEILDADPDVKDPPDPLPLGRADGLVEFERVGFGYVSDRLAVRDIQLRVEPSTKVAIVGPTGCGKSTLMSLLLRFYDPSQGEIRLDGVPLHRLEIAELRRQIAVVPQDPTIFSQSPSANIRYGAADADMTRVQAAARAALVHEFALSLPRGYDTLVGEGGYKLSQGERQRLAIARAFCQDSPVIVLDEATSCLDSASEALIQAALANLLACRTAFVIAHRLATVVDSDLILVMDGGRIVQSGTHEELLADPQGLYAQLAACQLNLPVSSLGWRAGETAEPRPYLVGAAPTWQRDPLPAAREARSA